MWLINVESPTHTAHWMVFDLSFCLLFLEAIPIEKWFATLYFVPVFGVERNTQLAHQPQPKG